MLNIVSALNAEYFDTDRVNQYLRRFARIYPTLQKLEYRKDKTFSGELDDSPTSYKALSTVLNYLYNTLVQSLGPTSAHNKMSVIVRSFLKRYKKDVLSTRIHEYFPATFKMEVESSLGSEQVSGIPGRSLRDMDERSITIEKLKEKIKETEQKIENSTGTVIWASEDTTKETPPMHISPHATERIATPPTTPPAEEGTVSSRDKLLALKEKILEMDRSLQEEKKGTEAESKPVITHKIPLSTPAKGVVVARKIPKKYPTKKVVEQITIKEVQVPSRDRVRTLKSEEKQVQKQLGIEPMRETSSVAYAAKPSWFGFRHSEVTVLASIIVIFGVLLVSASYVYLESRNSPPNPAFTGISLHSYSSVTTSNSTILTGTTSIEKTIEIRRSSFESGIWTDTVLATTKSDTHGWYSVVVGLNPGRNEFVVTTEDNGIEVMSDKAVVYRLGTVDRTVNILASGHSADGEAPKISVLIDRVPAKDLVISATEAHYYSFPWPMNSGIHSIDIFFRNPYGEGGNTRELNVYSVSVGPAASSITHLDTNASFLPSPSIQNYITAKSRGVPSGPIDQSGAVHVLIDIPDVYLVRHNLTIKASSNGTAKLEVWVGGQYIRTLTVASSNPQNYTLHDLFLPNKTVDLRICLNTGILTTNTDSAIIQGIWLDNGEGGYWKSSDMQFDEGEREAAFDGQNIGALNSGASEPGAVLVHIDGQV